MKAEPRIAVFCRCGAQWYGVSVYRAVVNIESHRERCGEPIPAQTFELLGYRIGWPNHWTDAERDAVRSESLAEATRRGKTPDQPPPSDS